MSDGNGARAIVVSNVGAANQAVSVPQFKDANGVALTSIDDANL